MRDEKREGSETHVGLADVGESASVRSQQANQECSEGARDGAGQPR